jgi:hypothetical protein
MKTLRTVLIATMLAASLAACERSDTEPAKVTQSAKAREAANSINFTENAEIDNIKHRLELTSNPGAVGFVLLMNEAGQPIMYASVKGKITSGSKRLTEPDRSNAWGQGTNNVVRAAPSDEGTYGSSDAYVFFWTAEGSYIQWNGKYLYSDKPFRVKVEPLVVAEARKS